MSDPARIDPAEAPSEPSATSWPQPAAHRGGVATPARGRAVSPPRGDLPRRALRAEPRRAARADRGRTSPSSSRTRTCTSTRPTRRSASSTPCSRAASGRDEVLREPFSYGEGITGWAVEHREAVLANQAHLDPRVRFVAGNARRAGVAHRGPARRPRQPQGDAEHLPVGGTRSSPRRSSSSRPASGTLPRSRSTTRTSARASSTRPRRTRSPASTTTARSTSACAQELHARIRAARHGRARDGRPRRLQEGQRRLRPRRRGPGAAPGGRGAARLRPSDATSSAASAARSSPIIVPSGDLGAARSRSPSGSGRASRSSRRCGRRPHGLAGIAIGPDHAANPRELVACAEAAMMTAKTRGNGLVVVFDETATERPARRRLVARTSARSRNSRCCRACPASSRG